LRFIFFIIFLLSIFAKTKTLANYTATEAVFFYLTFNLIDTLAQLFFREVYRFRSLVISGDFDLILTKPVSPLFRALAGGSDPLDLFMLAPYIGSIVFVGSMLHIESPVQVLLYVVLVINGFILATGFHILVLSLAIVTTEIDHSIMIYRDLTSMGRVPVDIYREPLRSIITFVIPVGLMMTFPAKAMLGMLSVNIALAAVLGGILFLVLTLRIWQFALTRYTSASS
jgi:ABC-2 type transport system permease protein